MAQPTPFHAKPRSPLEALHARIDAAPQEHVAAILAAYDVLQALHDRGVLELLKNGLEAGDELLEMVVSAANTPESVRAIRNLLFWRTILGQIEPEWFQGIFQAIPDGLAEATAQRDEPVSLWKVLRRGVSKDSLRGLTAAVDFLQSFGRHLNSLEHAVVRRQPGSGRG